MSGDDSRGAFFDTVYRNAGGDAAAVPWADLKPKDRLEKWLSANPGRGRRAVDIGCGLGDNAEAIAAAGWRTSAFDLAPDAIEWAKKRFPDSAVDYRVADLTELPPEWIGAFALVHECYTLQSVPPPVMPKLREGVASLVARGGTLLVYARIRPNDAHSDGPPWPLEEREANAFAGIDFERVTQERFVIERHGRAVEHVFAEWRKSA